jgi:hypothetical protein
MVAIADLPPLASPAQLEAYTKGKVKAADLRVPDALAAVSRSIRRRAGWHIFPVVNAHTLVLDGPGGTVLSLPTLKLVNLTAITEAGKVLDPVAGVDVSRETGLVKKTDGSSWTTRYGQVVVTMDHGEEEVPDLANLALKLAARGLASPMGATREQAGALSVNWSMVTQGVAAGITPSADERALMDSYVLTGWR